MLLKDLLSHYEGWQRNGRPVRNASQAVSVLFGLGLIQMELNEKDNQLTMSMWTRYVSEVVIFSWEIRAWALNSFFCQ